MTTRLEQRIEQMDNYFALQRLRNTEICINGKQGKIIYGETPQQLYERVHNDERLATIKEIMELRVLALDQLFSALGLRRDEEFERTGTDVLYLPLKRQMDAQPEVYGIWKTRLTTATEMIRADDEEGKDTLFFHDGPTMRKEEIIEAMRGVLVDGGFRYSPNALKKIIQETPRNARLGYDSYLKERGGNFTGMDWLEHPVFRTACGNDSDLMQKYVFALQFFDLFGFYNSGLHSGWCPRELPKEFGRPIALGYKGEAFYPPNNTTRGHAAFVVKTAY